MKKIKFILLMILIGICISVSTVYAQDKDYFIDEANLLNNEEEQNLEAILKEISERQNVDVVVLTVDSLGNKSSMDYADDYYDYSGYAYDGILYLLSMEYGDYWISTSGEGINIFTDAGLEYIDNSMIDYLRDGDFYEGFTDFALNCDQFISEYHINGAYDRGNLPMQSFNLFDVFMAVISGFLVALLIVYGMISQLKTVHMKPTAHEYVKENSFKLAINRDIFLYRTLNVTPRPKNNGGSSVHRGSSGRMHGGRGGRL